MKKFRCLILMSDLEPGEAAGVYAAMTDLQTSKRSGEIEATRDSTNRTAVGPEPREDFVKCQDCGGWIDCRDLAMVLAHLAPLPHPGQDEIDR